MSRPADNLPQFIPEFVLAQLESDANLARLRNPSVRHLVILLTETGIRGGDACVRAFNPMIDDSTGWPCLRFDNTKVRTEQLIPLSAKAAENACLTCPDFRTTPEFLDVHRQQRPSTGP